MNKKTIEEEDNILFPKFGKLIDLIDQLRDFKIKESIGLPRACALGAQNCGKSSLINSIIGLDTLPIGDGIITQRPLELYLHHINSGEPWVEFEEIKGEKFIDFIEVQKKIEALFEEIYGNNKNISDKPIVLHIYSQICPNLTLVDLPELIKTPMEGQENNIEEITKNISKKYIKDPLTIILSVIDADTITDIATSDTLKLAKEMDTNGNRTLVVLTKLDIIDKKNNVIYTLMNEKINLKFGFIIEPNIQKFYLSNNLSMEDIIEKGKEEFIKLYQVDKNFTDQIFGTKALIKKLIKMNFEIIKENLPYIVKYINEILKIAKEELSNLGIFVEEDGKTNLLLNKMDEYCHIFRNILEGKNANKRLSILESEEGIKIKLLYKKLLEEFTGDYKAGNEYTDEQIDNYLSLYENNSINENMFSCLLRPLLEKLTCPIEIFFEEIFQYIDYLSEKIMKKIFSRIPQAIEDMNGLLKNYFLEIKEKTKYLIDSVVEMEINCLFINDFEYSDDYSEFIQNYKKQKHSINNKKTYINEIRNRTEVYFKKIVRNLREMIPKIIGYNLIKEIEENMEYKLYNELINKNKGCDIFNEPNNITKRKKELYYIIKIIVKIKSIIREEINNIYLTKRDINKNELYNLINSQNNNTKSNNKEESRIIAINYYIKKIQIYSYLIYKYFCDDFKDKDFVNPLVILFLGYDIDEKRKAINSFFNIIKGIKLENNERLILIDDKNGGRQSIPGIHIYYLKDFNQNPVILIDCYGYDDIKNKEKITGAFSHLFEYIIEHINIVCFIIKETNQKLNIYNHYAIGNFTNLFSENILKNFIFLITDIKAYNIKQRPQISISLLNDLYYDFIKYKMDKKWYYSINNESLLNNEIDDLSRYSYEQLNDLYKIHVLNSKKVLTLQSLKIINNRLDIYYYINNIISNFLILKNENLNLINIVNELNNDNLDKLSNLIDKSKKLEINALNKFQCEIENKYIDSLIDEIINKDSQNKEIEILIKRKQINIVYQELSSNLFYFFGFKCIANFNE